MEHRATSTPAVTAVLASWVQTTATQPLPVAVEHALKRLLLDHLGAAIAGTSEPTARAVRDHALVMYPGVEATLIGGGRCGVLGAALANGTAAHSLEIDDGFAAGASHPSAATMPAVLALAERRASPAARTLVALAIGVEIACRVAAAGHPATWRRGFHNTALAGVFGAAAGCAALQGLDSDQTASALGLAGSRAAGVFEFLRDGANVKRLHPGLAARDGLAAVDLAARHVSGPSTIFEGEQGYFAAYAGDATLAAELVADLGARWRATEVYLKPYPCCRQAHGPIDAILQLRSEHPLTAADVARVDIATYEVAARQDSIEIGSLLSAQMSIPYAVAVALCDGNVGLDQFHARRRADADVASVMPKVRVRSREDLDALYPAKRPCEVRVETTDGRRLTAFIEQPLGECPPLDDAAVERKFLGLTSPVIGDRLAQELAAAVWGFESVPELFGLLRNVERAPAS